MASRAIFGGSSQDQVFSVLSSYLVVTSGTVVTFWSAQSGGTQVTDLTDMGGAPITSVTAGVMGYVPQFKGPDPSGSQSAYAYFLWADAGGGVPRVLVRPSFSPSSLDADQANNINNPNSLTTAALAAGYAPKMQGLPRLDHLGANNPWNMKIRGLAVPTLIDSNGSAYNYWDTGFPSAAVLATTMAQAVQVGANTVKAYGGAIAVQNGTQTQAAYLANWTTWLNAAKAARLMVYVTLQDWQNLAWHTSVTTGTYMGSAAQKAAVALAALCDGYENVIGLDVLNEATLVTGYLPLVQAQIPAVRAVTKKPLTVSWYPAQWPLSPSDSFAVNVVPLIDFIDVHPYPSVPSGQVGITPQAPGSTAYSTAAPRFGTFADDCADIASAFPSQPIIIGEITGWPAYIAPLQGALTSGTAYTSLTVGATPSGAQTWATGTQVVVSTAGGHSQVWTLTAPLTTSTSANSTATVGSQQANFSYAAGSSYVNVADPTQDVPGQTFNMLRPLIEKPYISGIVAWSSWLYDPNGGGIPNAGGGLFAAPGNRTENVGVSGPFRTLPKKATWQPLERRTLFSGSSALAQSAPGTAVTSFRLDRDALSLPKDADVAVRAVASVSGVTTGDTVGAYLADTDTSAALTATGWASVIAQPLTFTDSSVNGCTATTQGPVTQVASPSGAGFTNALSFATVARANSGTGGGALVLDQRGQTPNIVSGASPWTIECRFKATAVTAAQALIARGSTGGWGAQTGIDIDFMLYVQSGALQINIGGTGYTGPTVTAGTVYALMVAYDGTNIYWYLNGTKSATTTAPTIPTTFLPMSGGPITVGGFLWARTADSNGNPTGSLNGIGASSNMAYNYAGTIEDIRLSSVCRQSGASYTVPAAVLTADANTVLMLDVNTVTKYGQPNGAAYVATPWVYVPMKGNNAALHVFNSEGARGNCVEAWIESRVTS